MKVTVAGKSLTIRTGAKPKYVKALAAFVSAQVDDARRSGRTQTTQNLALLAAMNIADELFQLRESETQLKRDVREKTKKILTFLESADA